MTNLDLQLLDLFVYTGLFCTTRDDTICGVLTQTGYA